MDGAPALYLERGGRSLLTFEGLEDGRLELAVRGPWPTGSWPTAAAGRASSGSTASPSSGRPLEPLLAAAGFRTDLRGMVLRA